jgi:hypothetical protein
MGRKKPQVPPLRYAPVGMTIQLDNERYHSEIIDFSTKLSSRPERTRISYIAEPPVATYAASRKGSRMKLANATNLNRKSGVAQWRDLLWLFWFSRRL